MPPRVLRTSHRPSARENGSVMRQATVSCRPNAAGRGGLTGRRTTHTVGRSCSPCCFCAQTSRPPTQQSSGVRQEASECLDMDQHYAPSQTAALNALNAAAQCCASSRAHPSYSSLACISGSRNWRWVPPYPGWLWSFCQHTPARSRPSRASAPGRRSASLPLGTAHEVRHIISMMEQRHIHH